jgi:TRAP-type C4-dicarboxylate transport system permease small subunit
MMFVSVLRRVEDFLHMVAMVILIVMMLLGTADVFGRYFFQHPILGVREITASYLMVGLVWLSVARTERLGGHIGVDIAMKNRSPTVQAWTATFGRLLAMVPVSLIAWQTYEAMMRSVGQTTLGSIELWVAPSWGAVFVGTTVLFLTLASRVVADTISLIARAG